ncbi:MAG TPA: EAL domain-containing protein [Solirubrobacteraceae bacterium]|nr:EAL domain-containing protein [Solirubrobacteraceae bacterium]
MGLQRLAFVAAGVTVAATAGGDHWDAWSLALLAVFTVTSDLMYVETDSNKLKVSGSFLGLILAAVLLGGGPASLIGVLTIAIGWVRSREAKHYFRNNVVTYAWFPLAAALFFHLAVHLAHVGPRQPGYYLLVFAAFVVALTINFVMIAGYQCYLDGGPLVQKAREALRPILASELFSALLTVAAVYVAVTHGTVGLALVGLVLVVFQYLVSALLLSERRSEALQRMATTDVLTGLANRERFASRIDERIAARDQPGDEFAVMLIDLDHFKEINDTLGHLYGDALLRELGPRLADLVGSGGLVARLGGDEFAVLPPTRAHDTEWLEITAVELLGCIQQPLVVDELSLTVGASIGISRFPVDGADAQTLLRRADIAMYAAKSSQSGFKFYAAEQDVYSRRRLGMLGDFQRALAAEEIVVHYQPIVDVEEVQVCGAEALVRWQHPELGLLAPGAFLQLIEQTPMIGPLTRHVIDRALEQCARWRAAGHELAVSVNLSVRNLVDPNLPDEIERMLATHSLPAAALHLEITEGMIMSDPDRAVATLTSLSALGIRLSIDDFGTGYSSLANLTRMPVSELKIDRSFVTSMLADESDLIIVRSTINLGHDLGLEVVAEGVEDGYTLARLGNLGCDRVQGYHISRPLAPEAFAAWLASTEAAADTLLEKRA